MKIGFTASRNGMSNAQKDALRRLLKAHFVVGAEFHHGCCIGGDEEAHIIARGLGYWIVLHPPTDLRFVSDAMRANFNSVPGSHICEPLPYLKRNREIVEETVELIAAPKEDEEPAQKRGGGTWATIRCARRLGRPVTILER